MPPPTDTRQPPHIPVPSTMIALSETVVGIPYGRVSSATARIIGTGPTAKTASIEPASQTSLSASVTNPWPAVAAVVGADDDLAGRPQLVLEDDPFAGAAADHARDLDAASMELLGDREDHRGADAAADADHPALVDQVGRPSERPGHVADHVTGLEGDEVDRALADGLDDQGDRARGRVGVGDGQRDPLGSLAEADDDELAGPADLGDPRRLDDEPGDVRRELIPGDDRMHTYP